MSFLFFAVFSIQLYGLTTCLYFLSTFQLFEFFFDTKNLSGTKNCHCGSKTSFFQLFWDLGQLRVCAGQVNNWDFFVRFPKTILDPAQGSRQQAKSLAGTCWRLKDGVFLLIKGLNNFLHVIDLGLIRLIWEINCMVRNVEFFLAGDFGLVNYEVKLLVFVGRGLLSALFYSLIFRQIRLVLVELKLVQTLLEIASLIFCHFIFFRSIKAALALVLFLLVKFLLMLLDKLSISLLVAKSRYRRFLLASIAIFSGMIAYIFNILEDGFYKLFVQFWVFGFNLLVWYCCFSFVNGLADSTLVVIPNRIKLWLLVGNSPENLTCICKTRMTFKVGF